MPFSSSSLRSPPNHATMLSYFSSLQLPNVITFPTWIRGEERWQLNEIKVRETGDWVENQSKGRKQPLHCREKRPPRKKQNKCVDTYISTLAFPPVHKNADLYIHIYIIYSVGERGKAEKNIPKMSPKYLVTSSALILFKRFRVTLVTSIASRDWVKIWKSWCCG